MNHPDPAESVPRRSSLEVLRAEASDERAVLVEERLRLGEDPWEFMEELPSVDELVVIMLRAENIAANSGARPNPTRHYRVLRQIALQYPELTPTVWRMLGNDGTNRLWDEMVRADVS